MAEERNDLQPRADDGESLAEFLRRRYVEERGRWAVDWGTLGVSPPKGS